jgi:hypothetical protein
MSDGNEDYVWVPGDQDLAEDAEGRPYSATSQEGRTAFLRGLDADPAPARGTDLISRISVAEERVAVCEQADLDAQHAMRLAQGEAPRFAHDRTLSPDERSAYLRFDQAAVRCSETSQSLARARRVLNELLQAYDVEAGEMRLAMDGRLARRRLRDPREDGWG